MLHLFTSASGLALQTGPPVPEITGEDLARFRELQHPAEKALLANALVTGQTIVVGFTSAQALYLTGATHLANPLLPLELAAVEAGRAGPDDFDPN
jgi:hypothetical protein